MRQCAASDKALAATLLGAEAKRKKISQGHSGPSAACLVRRHPCRVIVGCTQRRGTPARCRDTRPLRFSNLSQNLHATGVEAGHPGSALSSRPIHDDARARTLYRSSQWLPGARALSRPLPQATGPAQRASSLLARFHAIRSNTKKSRDRPSGPGPCPNRPRTYLAGVMAKCFPRVVEVRAGLCPPVCVFKNVGKNKHISSR